MKATISASRRTATIVQRLSRPNLQVTQVLGPAEVTSGGVIDVEFTITNTGPAATGSTGGSRWTDYVYLANNNQPGGILLGALPNGSALEPGQAYTTRAMTIRREAAVKYFIVIVADALRSVDEFQRAQRPKSGLAKTTISAPLRCLWMLRRSHPPIWLCRK